MFHIVRSLPLRKNQVLSRLRRTTLISIPSHPLYRRFHIRSLYDSWYVGRTFEGVVGLLATTLFAGLREQLALNNVPKAFKGIPIALITASLLAMAFMGFSGLV